MSRPPREYEAAVLERLWDEVRHGADLNAALGYVVDPRLPAPEVFERPGWRVVWADPEADRWVIARTSPMSFVARPEPDPMDFPKIETEIVTPLVWVDAVFWFAPQEVWQYALGFSVRERVWVVFRRTPASPQTEGESDG